MRNNDIWIINYYTYPPGISTGTRHYDFSKELVKKGYKVDIFHSSFVFSSRKQQKEEINEVKKVKFHKIKNNGYNSNISRIISEIKFMFSVLKYSKKLNKPDIIIGSSGGLFNGLTAYILSKRYNSKFIFEIRDIWPETWVEMRAVSRKSPIYLIFRLLEIFLYKKSNKIIALLPGMYKHLQKSKIKEDKIEWISNGVDLKKFDYNAKNISSPIKLEENKFNILYTGAIGRANVLCNLVKVAKKLKENNNENILMNIVGNGPLKEELKKNSKNIKNIIFKGSVNKSEIPNLLSNADVLIVIMKKGDLYKYGISLNKSFEYLASELPIVFSGNVMNDFVKDSKCGISVDAEDIDAIYNAIIKLYNMSKEERNQLGENGRKYVEENFDIPILAGKLDKLIQEL
jgi:glycosyltransferase involved in cell wall biosynthesis